MAEDVLKFNWDGLYNGRLLPSGTYWYVMEIDGHYTRTGWIFLKTDKIRKPNQRFGFSH